MAEKNPYKNNPSTEFTDIDELDKSQAKKQIEKLRDAIEYHNYLYYIKNKPVIADETFDKLFRRLQDLEEHFPEFESPNSPTRRVGAAPVDELKKVEHTSPMLSLDSALEEEKLENWDDFVKRNTGRKKIDYVVEPKLDGLSVEVVYENGAFQYGSTRGDGQVGEDISENLRTIKTLPLQLRGNHDVPSFLAVRGEVLMSRQGFQKLNKFRIEHGKDPFANPRNAAAGIVRQLDSKNVADKPLEIFFYDILTSEGNGFSSHWNVLETFPEWGLKTNPYNKKASDFKEIEKYHDELAENRDNLDYEIDGIVIKVDDYGLRQQLGTRQRNPRWAMAWKFQPKKQVTDLVDIVVQVGRTGMLTPVALLDPVNVGGVTVSRATLHNEDEVRKKDVRPGDKVRIVRAGDVIPEVVERVNEGKEKRAREFRMPKKCPVCGTKIVREGAYYFCPAGLSCEAQLIGRIIHYVSRDAMDIRNLGDKIVRQLVERGMVKDLADLYHLSVDDILQLEGFAQKSAKQLHDAIQGAKNPRLDTFLYALGIRHVGEHIARVLAREFGDLKSIRTAGYDDLIAIQEIGPEIAQTVSEFFQTKENQKIIDRLLKAGVEVQELKSQKKKTLDGRTFVFTGELDEFSRSEAKEIVESLGGRSTSSVSGNTDYVVAGENPGSKLDAARENDVQVIDENAFKKLIGR